MKQPRTIRLFVLAGAAIALAFFWFAGPRVSVDATLRPATLSDNLSGSRLGELDTWLAAQEEAVPDLRANTEKRIVWADPTHKERTAIALVYIHGFSATRQEMAPLPEEVAAQLGANLFYTRLTGHGSTGAALAAATVNDWINDIAQAVAIGEALGDKVVLLGTSTGGGLLTWMAAEGHLDPQVAGLVLFSPNYGSRATGSELLLGPWARPLARLVLGTERSWEPNNEDHARYWTYRYPVEAAVQAMATVGLIRGSDPARIRLPIRVYYSPDDTVVNTTRVQALFDQIGSTDKTLVPVLDGDDPDHHILAGDILSPSTTARLTDEVVQFIQRIVQ